MIPHTYLQTNLAELKPDEWVNLEADILGKYVEKLMAGSGLRSRSREMITPDFLSLHGYQ